MCFKSVSILSVAAAIAVMPAAADCTQQSATQKMQSILTSPQYRDVVSRTGEMEEPSTERTIAKSGLRNFGGRLGRMGADVLQSEDNAAARNSAQESAQDTLKLTTAMNDAGSALGRGDLETACLLYDQVITDLGIAPQPVSTGG